MEIEDLQRRNHHLEEQYRNLYEKSSSIPDMERKIAILSQEIERLHMMNQDKSMKYDEVIRSKSIIESEQRAWHNDRNRLNDEIRRVSTENNGLKYRIDEVESERRKLVEERGQMS